MGGGKGKEAREGKRQRMSLKERKRGRRKGKVGNGEDGGRRGVARKGVWENEGKAKGKGKQVMTRRRRRRKRKKRGRK